MGNSQIRQVDNLEINEENINLIVSSASLVKGPLLERRKAIRKSFVLAALSKYPLNSEFEINKLSGDVETLTKCRLSDEEIISIISQLVLESEDKISHIQGFKYRINIEIDLPNFSQKTETVWIEFLEFMKKHYKKYDSYFDSGAKDIFESFLLMMLTKFSASSEALDKQIENLPINDFQQFIRERIKFSSTDFEKRVSTELSKKLPDIIHMYFMSKSPKMVEFIFNNYSYIIDIDLIKREKNILNINYLDYLDFLLMDTTFLVALMCKTDSIHPLASALANQCSKLKIKLNYTDKTRKEMWDLITGSKYEMKVLTPSKKHHILRSQFVKDFRKLKKSNWNDYITILENWEEILRNNWNITPLSQEDFSISFDEASYDYIKSTIPILDQVRISSRLESDPNYRPNPRDFEQIEHDAYCISLIYSYREAIKLENRKILIGAWFLTYDNLISTLDNVYFRRRNDIGLTIQPRQLLNYFLVYSRVLFDEHDQDAVAEAIIKFTARSPEPRLDLNEYIELLTYKMGLSSEDVAVIQNIFILSPLKEELEKAVKADEGGEADRVVSEIISDGPFVQMVLESSEYKKESGEYKKKYIKAVRELRETTEELDKERSARQSLEKMLKPEINITTNVNTTIDINIKNELDILILLLEADGAFNNDLLEKPADISDKEKLLSWLKDVEQFISTSDKISKGLSTLLPLVGHLIDKVQGCLP